MSEDEKLVLSVNKAVCTAIKALPSARPERLTDDDFETIRIHLNAYKEKLCNQHRWEEADEYQRIIDRFMSFASAQPDVPDTNVGDMISRQAAIKAFKDFLTIHDSRGVEYLCSAVTMDGVNKILSDLPSVDAVKVVRCKDCYHYDEESEKCIINNSEMKPIDYCSYGSK